MTTGPDRAEIPPYRGMSQSDRGYDKIKGTHRLMCAFLSVDFKKPLELLEIYCTVKLAAVERRAVCNCHHVCCTHFEGNI